MQFDESLKDGVAHFPYETAESHTIRSTIGPLARMIGPVVARRVGNVLEVRNGWPVMIDRARQNTIRQFAFIIVGIPRSTP